MTLAHTNPILAIDGGGTRCRIACADGEEVVSVETGSANVSTDFDGSVEEILKGIEQLGRRLGQSVDALCHRPAFVGLAGVTGPEIAGRLERALPFTQVQIRDDRPAALRGALTDADGFLVHCGTGSFLGAQTDGQQRFVGGWGPVLGDEASAQWVGRTALGATLESVDQIRPQSPLAERLLSELEGAAGIVRFASKAEPAEFGKLARLVTEADAQGDVVASDVMRAGAGKIADTLHLMGWQPGLPICLTGGIGPYYERHLPDDMRENIEAPKGTPLDGAIALAFEFAR
ncbi:MAG: BadF/BadG/BcrA/BcrD ATPase family protein, partial [Pseudomonadota bacterium]